MSDRGDDSALVRRAQAGDKRAFDLLVLKYQHKVANMAYAYVRDHHKTMEVTQNSFIKAYRRLKYFSDDCAFDTWLYHITEETAKSHRVVTSRHTSYANNKPYSRGTSDQHSKKIVDQVASTVKNTLDSLPTVLQKAITLKEQQGMTYSEIADIMECSVSTVRYRIYRARELINQQLRPLLANSDRAGV